MLPDYFYPLTVGCLLVLLVVLSVAVGRLRTAASRLATTLEDRDRRERTRARMDAAHDRPTAPPEAATNPNLAPPMHTAERRRVAGYPEVKVREARGLFIERDGATPTRDAPGLGYAWDMRSNSMRSVEWWAKEEAKRATVLLDQQIAALDERAAELDRQLVAVTAAWNSGHHPAVATQVAARDRAAIEHTAQIADMNGRLRDLRASFEERLRKAETARDAADARTRAVAADVREELEASRTAIRVAHARIAELEGPEAAQARIDERVEQRRQEREARQAETFDLDAPAPVFPAGDDDPAPMVRRDDGEVARVIRDAGAGIIAELQRQHANGEKS